MELEDRGTHLDCQREATHYYRFLSLCSCLLLHVFGPPPSSRRRCCHLWAPVWSTWFAAAPFEADLSSLVGHPLLKSHVPGAPPSRTSPAAACWPRLKYYTTSYLHLDQVTLSLAFTHIQATPFADIYTKPPRYFPSVTPVSMQRTIVCYIRCLLHIQSSGVLFAVRYYSILCYQFCSLTCVVCFC